MMKPVLVALALALTNSTPSRLTLTRDLNASYSITYLNFATDLQTARTGMVYEINVPGMFTSPTELVTPTFAIENGVPHLVRTNHLILKSKKIRSVQAGQRFLLVSIVVKDDRLVFKLCSVDFENVVSQGFTGQDPLSLNLELPLVKNQIDSLTVDQVHALMDPIFSPAKAAPGTISVQIGQTASEVTQTLGKPDQTIDAGNKQILLYPRLKVTLIEGRVVSIE